MTGSINSSPRSGKDDRAQLPWLARRLLWTDNPRNVTGLVWALAALCAGLALADFIYHKHGYFPVEQYPAIYGVFGFVVYAAVVLLARGLRLFVRRPEGYYEPLATDTEDERAAGSAPDAPDVREARPHA
ncbi:MAG: hypothetical protein WD034_12835 [Parvibaculum sp.]|uniref:hypothetical protein n=1 Tax=Parvibaculum sp. TaxID=2024848 RepID=UPI00349FF720